jgi:ABC-type uncharacterized transport system substrate-binding protein
MQFGQLKRREFITLLGGATAWPLTARAQQPAMPVVGFLNSGSAAQWTHLVAAFRKGLSETGYTKGQNVAVEYRWADGNYDSLPALAVDLVRRQVAVIVSTGGEPPALAAKQATQTIPIVVALGLVATLNRPGGNATGVSLLPNATATKRWDLLHDLVPGATPIAYLAKSDSLSSQLELKALQPIWASLGQQVNILSVRNEREIDAAFSTLVELHAGALFVPAEALFTVSRDQIVALAARHAVPAIYPFREFVAAGGLMSYGASLATAYRLAGVYAGRILVGEKTADLGGAADAVRVRHQPQDCQDTRSRHPAEATRLRRRGDRIARRFAAVQLVRKWHPCDSIEHSLADRFSLLPRCNRPQSRPWSFASQKTEAKSRRWLSLGNEGASRCRSDAFPAGRLPNLHWQQSTLTRRVLP